MREFQKPFLFLFFLLLFPFFLSGKEQKNPAAIQEYDLHIPYKDEALGILFPGKLGDFTKRFVRVNANEAVGTAIHYEAAGNIAADIYLYQPERLANEKTPDFLARHYKMTRQLLYSMEQKKKLEDLPGKEELFFRELAGKETEKGASFYFTVGEESFYSVLYMTLLEKGTTWKLVKIRFSCPVELGKEGEKKWGSFHKDILKLFPAPGK